MPIVDKLRIPPEYRTAIAVIAFGLALFFISVGVVFAEEHWHEAETSQSLPATGH